MPNGSRVSCGGDGLVLSFKRTGFCPPSTARACYVLSFKFPPTIPTTSAPSALAKAFSKNTKWSSLSSKSDRKLHSHPPRNEPDSPKPRKIENAELREGARLRRGLPCKAPSIATSQTQSISCIPMFLQNTIYFQCQPKGRHNGCASVAVGWCLF